jgi:hypothetical protein
MVILFRVKPSGSPASNGRTLAVSAGLGENHHMMRKTFLVLACGGIVALVACSADTTDDKYGDTGSFCAAKADAECQQLAAGCGASVDSCKTIRTSTCTNAVPGGRTYTSSKAQACIDKITAVYSKKSFTADEEKDVQNLCGRVFAGSVQKNQACQSDFDCAGDMICDKGVCGDKAVKNTDDGCNNPGEVCNTDAYCGNRGNLKFCIAKNQQDANCDKDNPCLDTLRCIIGSGVTNGTCKPKLNPGDPCDTTDQCPAATTPAYCDSKQKKCLPEYGLGTQSCVDYGGH